MIRKRLEEVCSLRQAATDQTRNAVTGIARPIAFVSVLILATAYSKPGRGRSADMVRWNWWCWSNSSRPSSWRLGEHTYAYRFFRLDVVQAFRRRQGSGGPRRRPSSCRQVECIEFPGRDHVAQGGVPQGVKGVSVVAATPRAREIHVILENPYPMELPQSCSSDYGRLAFT